MRLPTALLALTLCAAPALAQPSPDPTYAALGQMLGEAQHREFLALRRAAEAERKLEEAKALSRTPAPSAPSAPPPAATSPASP